MKWRFSIGPALKPVEGFETSSTKRRPKYKKYPLCAPVGLVLLVSMSGPIRATLGGYVLGLLPNPNAPLVGAKAATIQDDHDSGFAKTLIKSRKGVFSGDRKTGLHRPLKKLLDSPPAREQMKRDLAEVRSKLGPGGAIERAAEIIATML